MINNSINDVLGLAGEPVGVGETHEVLRMYTSCSRTDSEMRMMDSPASLRVTVLRPRGSPSRKATKEANSRCEVPGMRSENETREERRMRTKEENKEDKQEEKKERRKKETRDKKIRDKR